MIVSATLVSLSVIAGGDLSGKWSLKMEPKVAEALTLPGEVEFRQTNDKLAVYALFEKLEKVAIGTIKGDEVELRLASPGSVAGFNPKVRSIKGYYSEGQIVFVGRLDATVMFRAIRLASAWVCSNHEPHHMASSRAQMVELSSRFGCRGWMRPGRQASSAIQQAPPLHVPEHRPDTAPSAAVLRCRACETKCPDRSGRCLCECLREAGWCGLGKAFFEECERKYGSPQPAPRP